MRPDLIWPIEDVAELRRLHEDEGLSFSQVALRLGRTRNACLGRYTRLQGRHLAGGHVAKNSRGSKPTRWSTEALTERWADRKRK